MPTVSGELRALLPAWAVAVLLPVPVATFWHEGSGRDFAYAYLFLGCAIVVAESFGRRVAPAVGLPPDMPGAWRTKLSALVLAVAGAVIVFTAFVWAMTGRPDAGVPLFAALAVLPALGCVPFAALATGRPYVAVLFAAFLMAAVKMAGCVVVVLVYGWNAQAGGHTTLPWERPNLLVWLCLAGALACVVVFYPLGRREFLRAGSP